MHSAHNGRDIVIGIDSDGEAKALYGVLSGNTAGLSPEQIAFGQNLYKFFFESVQKLAVNYEEETRGFHKTSRPPRSTR